MRIATFNILHGQVVSGARQHSKAHLTPVPDSGDLLSAVDQLAPDVIAIQELDHNQPRSGNAQQAREIADRIGASHVTFVPTVIGTPNGRDPFRSSRPDERDLGLALTDPTYGIALISKLEPIQTSTLVFPPAPMGLPLLVQSGNRPAVIRVRDEQRGVIASVFETEHGHLTVATAHLSFVPGFNYRQLQKIGRWLQSFPRPLVLVGDFNLPTPLPRQATKLVPVVEQPTYPSYAPRIQFDHVLVDGFDPQTVANIKASAKRWTMAVSDHCAITVDL